MTESAQESIAAVATPNAAPNAAPAGPNAAPATAPVPMFVSADLTTSVFEYPFASRSSENELPILLMPYPTANPANALALKFYATPDCFCSLVMLVGSLSRACISLLMALFRSKEEFKPLPTGLDSLIPFNWLRISEVSNTALIFKLCVVVAIVILITLCVC